MVQQARICTARKTRCCGTQIQTSTSKRGTMGPRNKCGDDNIGCMFFVKLASMGLEPGEPRSTFAAERPSRPCLRKAPQGEGLGLLLPKHTHYLNVGRVLELIDRSERFHFVATA